MSPAGDSAEPVSETLIRGGTLAPMDGGPSLRRWDVLLAGRDIVWLGPAGKVPRKRVGVQRERVDARDCLVLPGFVQAHVHLCQALFRGVADDLPLMPWLSRRIWPLEAAHDPASLEASAEQAVVELLRGGTTCVLDMGTVHHQEVVFEVLDRAGLRGFSGKSMIDRGRGLPRGFRQGTRRCSRESESLAQRWHRHGGGRLGYAFAPRFVLSCSAGLLRDTADCAREMGALLHTHVAEHAEERRLVRDALGKDDLAYLAEHGLAGEDVVLAHGVQLRRAELRAAARAGTRLVHCPATNLKLASGVADVVAMRSLGIVVGLGCDGAPCNNRLDAISELRLAAQLARVQQSRAEALPAHEALAMLTIDGARCLGLDAQIGSLEVGKRADLVVVDIARPHHLPAVDPLSALVYSSTAEDVRDVWIDGHARVRGGTVLGVDMAQLAARSRSQLGHVMTRAGLRR